MLLLMDGEIFDKEKTSKQIGSSEPDDATYCLSLFEKWKDKAFERLNGSFSIAAYDFKKRELLLVTDRFCSRPIFYTVTDDGTIFFGSRLSSVLVSPQVNRDLNVPSIFELLTLQSILGTKTIYKHIHVVPPATILRFTNDQISMKKYWQLQYSPIERSEKFYVAKLSETLKRAVEVRMGTDCRYGLLLSGGVDSRTVLAAATKEIVAFTVCENENREVRVAREIALAKGCKHVIIPRAADHYIRIIDKAVELSDCLYASVHAHFINLFGRMQKETDIVLHGFVPAMPFKGEKYPYRIFRILNFKFHTQFRADSYLNSLSDDKLIEAFLAERRFVNQLLLHDPRQVFAPNVAIHFQKHIRQTIKEIVKDAHARGATPADVWGHIVGWHAPSKSYGYLHVSHIRPFAPERTVMFDNALFDLCLQMPVQLRRNAKVYRKASKKLNERLAVIINSNTGFSFQIHPLLKSILFRVAIVKRIIFPNRQILSESSWPNHPELLRQNSEYQVIFEATIRDPECLDPSIFNINGILKLLKDHVDRTADHFTLLSLILTFGRWQKIWMTES